MDDLESIRIYGWMNRMGLGSIAKTMFALIHERERLGMSPILTYSDFISVTGASETTVIRLLKDMMNRKYISREAVNTNVGSYYRYQTLVDEHSFREGV